MSKGLSQRALLLNEASEVMQGDIIDKVKREGLVKQFRPQSSRTP